MHLPTAYRTARSRDGSRVVDAIRREGGRAEAVEADLANEPTPALLFDCAERASSAESKSWS